MDSLGFSLTFVPLDPPAWRKAGVVVFPGFRHLTHNVETVPHQLNVLLAEKSRVFEDVRQPRPSALQLDSLWRLQECDCVAIRAVDQSDLPPSGQAGVAFHPIVVTDAPLPPLSRRGGREDAQKSGLASRRTVFHRELIYDLSIWPDSVKKL